MEMLQLQANSFNCDLVIHVRNYQILTAEMCKYNSLTMLGDPIVNNAQQRPC